MAKITSKQDFINIFSSLEIPKITNTGEICLECIEDLRSQSMYNAINLRSDNDDTTSGEEPACTCKWSCHSGPCDIIEACNGNNAGNCCEPSGPGCGLFFFGTCTRAIKC